MANEVIGNLPEHLKQYIVNQNHSSYTAVDHAVWRYIMRKSKDFLKINAHESYLSGLEQSGLKTETIPSIEEMNRILSQIGWAAVPVEGFIPPAAFMEFQAYRVLVIAADMRQLNHIQYTPSPDIVHEAAGHAPIIVCPEYAEYLRLFGEVGSKAMSSKKDFELYEAIRKLSILKELPNTPQKDIDEAEKTVLDLQNNLGEPSEMALLSRLHWWTVEYGLVGQMDNPKIYGAGLLSSIGESEACLKDGVEKIPYNMDTVNYAFDITTQQPQLFVTPNFRYLTEILEEFSKDMAFKVGGKKGMELAIECNNTCTAVYSSGLQVSGTFTEVITDAWDRPIFIRTTGPTNLSYMDKELAGHDIHYHKDGFSSPVGNFKGVEAMPEHSTLEQLNNLGIKVGQPVDFEFESGIKVNGTLIEVTRKDNHIILMSFENCTVTYKDQVLFQPEWGTYDMAIGEKIVSVCAGAADKDAYEQPTRVSKTRIDKVQYDDHTLALHRLYQKVRNYRDGSSRTDVVPQIWETLRNGYPNDWLLPLEILEILEKEERLPEMRHDIKQFLKKLATKREDFNKLIHDGLDLIYN
jgi:phenylalanine-4-hydroxylase